MHKLWKEYNLQKSQFEKTYVDNVFTFIPYYALSIKLQVLLYI